jgi:hypothetical protein
MVCILTVVLGSSGCQALAQGCMYMAVEMGCRLCERAAVDEVRKDRSKPAETLYRLSVDEPCGAAWDTCYERVSRFSCGGPPSNATLRCMNQVAKEYEAALHQERREVLRRRGCASDVLPDDSHWVPQAPKTGAVRW